MLDPNHGRLPVDRGPDAHHIQLALALAVLTLAYAFHVLGAVNVNQLDCGCERTQGETLVELTFQELTLDQLDHAFVVHVSHLVVVVETEVGRGYDLANLAEVETLEADWCHFLSLVNEVELVKTFTLLIDLDPSVEGDVSEDFIFSLEAELLPKLAARLGAHDVVMPLLTRCRLERPLHIVEHSVAIESTALKVAIVVVSDSNDLLRGLHLLHNFIIGSVEDLDVSLVKSNHNEPIVAKSVHHLKLARHFLFELELIGSEKVYLHLLILA